MWNWPVSGPGRECLLDGVVFASGGMTQYNAIVTSGVGGTLMGTFTDRRCLVVMVSLSLLGLGGMLSAPPADAAIYRWDNGELITNKDT